MKHATIWQAYAHIDMAQSDSFFRTRREAAAFLKDFYGIKAGEGGEINKHRVPLNTDGVISALKRIPIR